MLADNVIAVRKETYLLFAIIEVGLGVNVRGEKKCTFMTPQRSAGKFISGKWQLTGPVEFGKFQMGRQLQYTENFEL
jgi:hypothetical protein